MARGGLEGRGEEERKRGRGRGRWRDEAAQTVLRHVLDVDAVGLEAAVGPHLLVLLHKGGEKGKRFKYSEKGEGKEFLKKCFGVLV